MYKYVREVHLTPDQGNNRHTCLQVGGARCLWVRIKFLEKELTRTDSHSPTNQGWTIKQEGERMLFFTDWTKTMTTTTTTTMRSRHSAGFYCTFLFGVDIRLNTCAHIAVVRGVWESRRGPFLSGPFRWDRSRRKCSIHAEETRKHDR